MNKWMSKVPDNCEICSKPFGVYFYDGSVVGKAWALMCEDCWKKYNGKLGEGYSQKYVTATQELIAGGMVEVE